MKYCVSGMYDLATCCHPEWGGSSFLYLFSLVISDFLRTFAPSTLETAVALKGDPSLGTTVSSALFGLLLLARAIKFVFCDSTVAVLFLTLCLVDRTSANLQGVLLDGRHPFIEI